MTLNAGHRNVGVHGRISPRLNRTDTILSNEGSTPTTLKVGRHAIFGLVAILTCRSIESCNLDRSLEGDFFFSINSLFDESESDEDNTTVEPKENLQKERLANSNTEEESLEARNFGTPSEGKDEDLRPLECGRDEVDSSNTLSNNSSKTDKTLIVNISSRIQRTRIFQKDSAEMGTKETQKMTKETQKMTITYHECCMNECEDCCHEMEKEMITWKENETTELLFKITDTHSEDGGMQLCTTDEGHYINVTDNSKFSDAMKLRSGDKILGINSQAVSAFQHVIVVEMLNYLLCSNSDDDLCLIIERPYQNGLCEIIEIKLDVQVETRGSPAVAIHASVLHALNRPLRIFNVRWKALYKCQIQAVSRSNCFILANGGRIMARPLLASDKGSSNVFKCYIFSGLCQNRRDNRSQPGSIFIAVFETKENAFMMAANPAKLTLMKNAKLDTSIRRIRNADPRFFVVHKTDTGRSYFESLLYKGRCWRMDDDGVCLYRFTNTDLYLRDDILFTIIRMDKIFTEETTM